MSQGEIKKIGEMTLSKSIKSGRFSIYDGKFRGEMDIKVRTVEDNKVNKFEVEKFVKLSSHPNVQRLISYEFYDSIHYFGLQNYDFNLYDFMQIPRNKRVKIDPISMVKDVTEGLKFLHDNDIKHENLNFKNVGINKMTKSAMLCYCGFDDLQEKQNIFIAPEEKPADNPSFKSDIFSLGCIIYFILSNGNHPFGSLKNPTDIVKNIKKKEFSREFKDFKNIIVEKAVKPNYKTENAIFLLKRIFKKNPLERPNCSEILQNPLFWNNFQIYNFFKEIERDWRDLTEEKKAVIDKRGSKYFRIHTWTYQLKSLLDATKYNLEERKSLVELFKFVVSKIKYYEEELYNNILSGEHLLYYLKEFPFLLAIIYNLNSGILNKKAKFVNFDESIASASNDCLNFIGDSELDSSLGKAEQSSTVKEENFNLRKRLEENHLPVQFLKSPRSVETGELISSSNSDVYCGKFEEKIVAVKKIKKFEFRISELKSINKLIVTDKSSNKEKYENIIKFYGCYEELQLYCIIMEKAEMNFKDFIKKNKKNGCMNDDITNILFDAVKGLEYMHSNDVPHLDIKSENILVVKRNDKTIGCLADFGESSLKIKKTFMKSREPGTKGYVAPELMTAAKNRKSNKRNKQSFSNVDESNKNVSLNYSKCDIFSLGIVIIQDCIGIDLTNIKISSNRSLSNLRQNGEINFLCEELANFMTESCPTDRPDAEGVRKNPFFWKDCQKSINFLKAVIKHKERHETNKERIKLIETEALKKMQKADWTNFFDDFKEVQTEIINYLDVENMSSKSIFDLVKLILFIMEPKSATDLPKTRKKLFESSNLETYLNFFFKKFEIIAFLYYEMSNDLKFRNRKFYSTETPKRSLSRRRMTANEKPKRERKLSTFSDISSEMSFTGIFRKPKVPRFN